MHKNRNITEQNSPGWHLDGSASRLHATPENANLYCLPTLRIKFTAEVLTKDTSRESL